jgi:cytidylate kinase
VYLTASEAERARRRSSELAGGAAATADALALTQADLARRDTFDSTRTASPLRRADDAIEVDTTGLDIDAVVARLVELLPEQVAR